jgi:hypothetical protein
MTQRNKTGRATKADRQERIPRFRTAIPVVGHVLVTCGADLTGFLRRYSLKLLTAALAQR